MNSACSRSLYIPLSELIEVFNLEAVKFNNTTIFSMLEGCIPFLMAITVHLFSLFS